MRAATMFVYMSLPVKVIYSAVTLFTHDVNYFSQSKIITTVVQLHSLGLISDQAMYSPESSAILQLEELITSDINTRRGTY